MNCRDFEPLIQRYLDGDISIEERSAVEKHIKECEVCRLELAEFEKLSHMLSSLEKLPTPKDFLQNVRIKIDAKQGIFQKLILLFSQHLRLRHSFGIAAIICAFIALFMWANLKTRTNQLSKDTNGKFSPDVIVMKDNNDENMPLMARYKAIEEKPEGTFHLAGEGRSKDSNELSEPVGDYGREVIAKEKGTGLLGGSASKPLTDEIEIKEDTNSPIEIASKDSSPAIFIEEKNGGSVEAEMDKDIIVSSISETESEKKTEETMVMLGSNIEKKERDLYTDSTKTTTKINDVKLQSEENIKDLGRFSGGSTREKEGFLTKSRIKSENGLLGGAPSIYYDENATRISIPIKNYNQDIKAINSIIDKEKATIVSLVKKEEQEDKKGAEISTIILKTKENNLKSLVDKLSVYNREKDKTEKSVKYSVSVPTLRTITVIITVEKP